MAYKFSVGAYRHSGSLVAEEGLTVDAGGLTVTGDVQLDNGVINNAELANSSVMFNGVTVALGATGSFGTDAVTEGAANKYYLDSRARAAVSVSDVSGDGSLTYDSGSGVITYTGPSASEVRAHFTGGAGVDIVDGEITVDMTEIAAGLSGSVEAIIGAFVEGSDFVTFDDANGTIGVSAVAFTASFDAVLAARDTADLAEGTNLYYTDARARNALSASDLGGDGSLSYNASTGVITYTGPSAAEARAHFSAVDAGGDGSFAYADGVFTYTGPSSTEVRAHLTAGDGLAYSGGQFALTASVAGAGLGYSAGVLDVLATGAMAVKSDRILLSSSVAGMGLGFIAGAQGDVSALNVNVDASSIEINADALRVKALGITNAMLSGGIENAKLVNNSVTVVAGDALSGGGIVALGASITLDVEVNGDALEITGDQIALKSQIAGAREFTGNVTIGGDLIVNGTTTYINTTELVVEDALIQIASGSAFAAGQGILLGTANSLQTVSGFADVGNALSSSLPLVAPSMKASTFYGNLEGAMLLGMETKSADATISKNVTRASANITLTLPSAPVTGQEHRIKCVGAANSVAVAAQSGATIDGAASILLESPSAAVSLVWDGSAWMVF